MSIDALTPIHLVSSDDDEADAQPRTALIASSLKRKARVWKFELEDRPMPPRQPIVTFRESYEARRRQNETERLGPQPQRFGRWSFGEIALAAMLILVVSTMTGVIVYDQLESNDAARAVQPAPAPAEVIEAPAAAASAPAAVVETQVPASRKPIATASVAVSDTSGEINSLIPLSLRLENGDVNPSVMLRLQGLPELAYLTSGNKLGKDGWLLKPSDAKNVKLVVPQANRERFLLSVAAVEAKTGDLVSPPVEMNVALRNLAKTAVILPAAAQVKTVTNFNVAPDSKPAQQAVMLTPNNTAQSVPLPVESRLQVSGEAEKLMVNGDSLMETGDVVAARAFYAKALALGAPEAALHLGKTYDPAVFLAKQVQGIKPDPAMAKRYYQQAAAAGVVEAKTALAELPPPGAQ